jgi:Galactose oxidase-like, Early set domain
VCSFRATRYFEFAYSSLNQASRSSTRRSETALPRVVEVEVSEHITSSALIAPSALAHQINPSQRYVGLGIDDRNQAALRLAGPPDANVAPPGWYLLFVVNDSGTPSVGNWIQVSSG